jgi:TrmH family RNA methyltransferase
VFIAEGVKIMDEIIHSDFIIQKIFALPEWLHIHPDLNNATEVTEAELQKISNFETPNKVLAIVKQKTSTAIPHLGDKITLVLDGIQDPGNMGTIIRTADWFGIENIIASTDTADVYNSKVVQSTMASIIRVNFFYTDLKEFFSGNNVPVYGAVLNGTAISAIQHIDEGILVIGNEGKGIRAGVLPFIQHTISIEKKGNAESLNAAVATGILLWKLCNT